MKVVKTHKYDLLDLTEVEKVQLSNLLYQVNHVDRPSFSNSEKEVASTLGQLLDDQP